MNKDLIAIFEYLEREKGIKREIVINAIMDSLRAAARKSVKGLGEKVNVEIHPKTGEIEVFTQKKIVEKVANPAEEISLEDARALEPECNIDQWLEISITPQDFGRIAAQAARQVITQKLKGAERDVIYQEYRHRAGELISGTIKRFIRGRTIVVDLGKVEAILPERNYPKLERYNVGEKLQALLYEVRDTEGGGAEVILSRSHPEFVKQLFIQEVPELRDKTVVIEKIVRDPGYRTKLAVRSFDSKVDPVGTCVGVRGTRIKNIIRELNNEKIDVVPFSDDLIQLLQNLLAPAEARKLKEYEDRVWMVVADDDYPTVIGKKGMNARLIGQMIGKDIDVQKNTEHQKLLTIQMAELGESDDPHLDEKLKIEGVSNLIIESLIGAGYDTLRKFTQSTPNDISVNAPGTNYYDLAEKILAKNKNKKS
ncbi:MAG: transcription termination factor NusA [Chlamydiae bacterium RIFCSPHIGHO2_12_FULL_44_59]|nr:MAG: transcription termination factor NusA [Chlamydiae bacterium RIFCSPHIGHO2_01_FULL_44_39]OGN59395.1 MAG: transcription termination factor NusA [Chlamydiae bacterium RIFCSPHIGHO2_02_FULL_45_9]OGN59633.1 MAG: transcription termination factor NusA [Chlamydiae bacterium RIFCSPHIGHO2_12_FULL_44_59]OGN65723.1 MAG: transcription termination factor NusA [Chlamydiae bacterium RIFCSPLOWO2_01_FULL_44_52]OGN67865.1 MAG: transcription termination factor NusA [Chlamydiae bacterium RIFCSPLOWO2_02_FULL_4